MRSPQSPLKAAYGGIFQRKKANADTPSTPKPTFATELDSAMAMTVQNLSVQTSTSYGGPTAAAVQSFGVNGQSRIPWHNMKIERFPSWIYNLAAQFGGKIKRDTLSQYTGNPLTMPVGPYTIPPITRKGSMP